MLTRLLRLLAPLTPRRRPRLFPIFRRGRFQTGLFRSRRPHPTSSPRPRTQRPRARPAAPAQPQPSSPTRQKTRPKLSLASPPPLGAGWREIAPPSPPPNPRRPAPARSPVRSPQPPLAAPLRTPQPPAQPSPHRHRQDLAHRCHTPIHPSPSVAWRVPESAKNRPAAPQEFFGKNSYARVPATSRVPNGPTHAPAGPTTFGDAWDGYAGHTRRHNDPWSIARLQPFPRCQRNLDDQTSPGTHRLRRHGLEARRRASISSRIVYVSRSAVDIELAARSRPWPDQFSGCRAATDYRGSPGRQWTAC